MQVNKVQSLNELMTSDSCVLKRNREDEDRDINRVSGVRLRFKPIHALSLLLVLVAALCASLTLLITQSVNYSRAETYRINSLKSSSYNDSSYSHYAEHESVSESNKEAEDDDVAESVGVKRVNGKRVNGKRVGNRHVDSKKSNASEDVSVDASVEKSEKKSATKSKSKSKSKTENKAENKVNSESSAEKSSCINLNTASVEKLQQLRGVGPKMAERIIAHRKRLGSFKRINDLMNVKGIGAKTLAKFREKVCFK